jgi:hypothetical protein
MTGEWRTAGEALVRRELRRETWAGVDHFVAGQQGCFIENGIAYVTYVDVMGHAVSAPFEPSGDGWLGWSPVGVAQRAGQYTAEPIRPLPDGWKPDGKMLDALRSALGQLPQSPSGGSR